MSLTFVRTCKRIGRRGLATLLGMVMASLEELVIERCHDLLTPGAFQAMGACRGLKARLDTPLRSTPSAIAVQPGRTLVAQDIQFVLVRRSADCTVTRNARVYTPATRGTPSTIAVHLEGMLVAQAIICSGAKDRGLFWHQQCTSMHPGN